MKKLALWILSASVAIGSVVIGMGVAIQALTAPAAVEAISPCMPGACPAGTSYQSPTVVGVGNTCAAARMNAETNAVLASDTECDRTALMCNFEFIEETGCSTNSQGQKQIVGHSRFNCAACLDIRPCV